MHWPRGVTGLCYGGDYNPEQWQEPVWQEDVALMREAGVNLVSVGVFAWSRLEPEPGRYDFDWLDRVLDLLHAGGVSVALATPTAAPPPWFSLAHPEALPVNRDGVRLTHGSRDTYCASAPAYRSSCLSIAGELANRYAGHPALALWHVHNEYGTTCHCDTTAAAFRGWLRRRYGDDLRALNDAWTTDFWGQRYSGWAQVFPPRATQYLANPAQELDFRRFTSDELRAAYTEQRDLLRSVTPDVPVTTNYVLGNWVPVDHWRWSAGADLVAIDHYPDDAGPGAEEQTAFAADLARGFAGRAPWLLMESAPNLIYTGGRMHTKEPGRLARHALSYLARGSRGAMFFQWRAPAGGAERFHSALVPHAGPDSRVFREAVGLGATLRALAETDVGTVPADVALAWDPESWWALQGPGLPASIDYLTEVRAAHRALWRCGITTDIVCLRDHPRAPTISDVPGHPHTPAIPGPVDRLPEPPVRGPRDHFPEPAVSDVPHQLPNPGGLRGAGDLGELSRYRLLLLPAHYLLPDPVADLLRRYVAVGGHLLVTPHSGIADQYGRIRTGGYPGALRDLLGVRVEEFHPLAPGEPVALSGGARGTGWAETVHLAGAETVSAYQGGVLHGRPAITRHRYGAGLAWYVSTRLDDDAYRALVADVAETAGARPVLPGLPPGVEAVRRRHGERSWLFLLNHSPSPVEVPATGTDLLTGTTNQTGTTSLPPSAVAVLRESGNPDAKATEASRRDRVTC